MRAARRAEGNVAATVDTIVRVHGTPVTVLVLGYRNVVKDGVRWASPRAARPAA